MMKNRLVVTLGTLSLLAFACGGEDAAPPESGTTTEIPATPIAGRYEVTGATVAVESGYRRDISGTVILSTEADTYTATFDLTTTYPDPAADEPIIAEVIGKGEGAVQGRTLRGTATTQIVASMVPNVDPGFAFIPRSVSTNIVSESVTTIAADGTVNIEIENHAAPGEDYTPTRTTLSGYRVAKGGVGAGAEPSD